MNNKRKNKYYNVVRFSFLSFLSFYITNNLISVVVIIFLLLLFRTCEDGNYTTDMV